MRVIFFPFHQTDCFLTSLKCCLINFQRDSTGCEYVNTFDAINFIHYTEDVYLHVRDNLINKNYFFIASNVISFLKRQIQYENLTSLECREFVKKYERLYTTTLALYDYCTFPKHPLIDIRNIYLAVEESSAMFLIFFKRYQYCSKIFTTKEECIKALCIVERVHGLLFKACLQVADSKYNRVSTLIDDSIKNKTNYKFHLRRNQRLLLAEKEIQNLLV